MSTVERGHVLIDHAFSNGAACGGGVNAGMADLTGLHVNFCCLACA